MKIGSGSLRDVARQLDADVPIYGIQTMTERLDRSLWARRAYPWLFGVFALIAITLAASGVYGVVSYPVSQRTREIGIRIALGARPAHVVGHVLTLKIAVDSLSPCRTSSRLVKRLVPLAISR